MPEHLKRVVHFIIVPKGDLSNKVKIGEEAILELLGNEGDPHFLGNTINRKDEEVLIEDIRSFAREMMEYLYNFSLNTH